MRNARSLIHCIIGMEASDGGPTLLDLVLLFEIPDIYWPVLVSIKLNIFHVELHRPAGEEDMFPNVSR